MKQTLKIHDWETRPGRLSFWGGDSAYFQGAFAVSFRELLPSYQGQEATSTLPVEALRMALQSSGESKDRDLRVLDLCAAPGSKV